MVDLISVVSDEILTHAIFCDNRRTFFFSCFFVQKQSDMDMVTANDMDIDGSARCGLCAWLGASVICRVYSLFKTLVFLYFLGCYSLLCKIFLSLLRLAGQWYIFPCFLSSSLFLFVFRTITLMEILT